MITIEKIINTLKDFCNTHKEIKEFSLDTRFKIDTKYLRKYPLVTVEPGKVYIKNNEIKLNLLILVADNMNEDESNKWMIQNKCLSISNDIVNHYDTIYGDYSEYDIYYNSEKGAEIDLVSHIQDNELAGVIMNLEFKIINYIDNCNLPIR